MTQKIVINTIHGGFGLSHEAILRYAEIKGLNLKSKESDLKLRSLVLYDYTVDGEFWSCRDIDRDDPALIQVIEEIDDLANGDYAFLKIVEIPDDVKWVIEEYDGCEWVAEVHRTWS